MKISSCTWTKLGYLTGAPNPASAPKNADWRDAAQPLDARASAYLDVNCGHCHNAKGPANTTALDLTIFAAIDRYLGVCKPPVAAGRGTGDHFFDIVPGNPQDSILPYRLRSSEPGRDDAGAGAHDHACRGRCADRAVDLRSARNLRIPPARCPIHFNPYGATLMTDQIDTGTLDLLATLHEGVLTLTLNRPEARNAMSEAMNRALAEQLAWAELAPSVKCVVLTGAGKGFCAGGDVKGMAERSP